MCEKPNWYQYEKTTLLVCEKTNWYDLTSMEKTHYLANSSVKIGTTKIQININLDAKYMIFVIRIIYNRRNKSFKVLKIL